MIVHAVVGTDTLQIEDSADKLTGDQVLTLFASWIAKAVPAGTVTDPTSLQHLASVAKKITDVSSALASDATAAAGLAAPAHTP